MKIFILKKWVLLLEFLFVGRVACQQLKIFFLMVLLFTAIGFGSVKAQTWGTPVPAEPVTDEGGDLGQYSTQCVVNGFPAIAYYDATNGDLKYIRATDADGTAWGTPVTVDTAGNVGQYTSLLVVNGYPAIAYYDVTNQDLKFVIASDANGTSWGTPVALDVTGDVGQYTSMQIVSGNPAIAYYDVTNGDLKYIRATDAGGTIWGTTVTVDATGNVGQYASMQVVNGNPAIAYFDVGNQKLNYKRATDATGTAWGASTFATTGHTCPNYGHASLQIVNGNPAIAYLRSFYSSTAKKCLANRNVFYARATDANGTTWGAEVNVFATQFNQYSPSLQIVNGYPVIVYSNDGYLVYIRATNANGSAWGSQKVLNKYIGVYAFPSVQIVNGTPAVSFYDETNKDLKYVKATDADGTTWGDDSYITQNTGQHLSSEIINGNPAIAYYDGANKDLKYVRATSSSGAAWGTPVTIDATGDVGQYTSIRNVNGYPAIAYYDATNLDLKYVRATDATGTAWGTPVTVDATGDVGQYASLQIVNGNPAIAYYDATNSDLKYIRSTDATGTAWGTPVTVDATGYVGRYPSLQIVNGNPAIAYFDNTNANLKYVRATGIDGASWGTPVTVEVDVLGTIYEGQYTSMQIVNENPAIAFYDYGTKDLKFVRASQVDGTAWGTPVTVDAVGDVGQYTSLQTVGGNPAIAYYDVTNRALKYAKAGNATGSAWGTPITLDATGMTGEYASMVNTASGVGIAYYNNLKNYPYYIHEIVIAPEIDVKQTTSSIADGAGSYDFGSQATSTNTDVVFTIENTGTAASTLGSFTITGTDAGQFSFQGTNPTTVANDSSATFTVRFTPTTAGAKTAIVSFVNEDTVKNPYNFTITGTAISVPTVTTQATSVITDTSAIANGNITATNGDNPTVRGVIYWLYNNIDQITTDTNITDVPENGSPDFSTGAFTRSLTGLSANTHYNTRAYATNPNGTAYGARVDFWTLANVPLAPTVNNPTATSLDVTVNTNANPSITEFAIQDSINGTFLQANGSMGATAVWQTATDWGTKTLTGLSAGVTYYYRVKARNGNNVETIYSTATSGMPVAPPIVTSQAASSLDTTSATGNGNIISTNGVNPTTRGTICYVYTNADKVIGDLGVTNVSESGNFGIGAFTSSLTGLAVNTHYSARVYAINSQGTGYSTRIDFWTLANIPVVTTVNNPQLTSLDVTINANGNPSITTYAIQETTGGKYVQLNGTMDTTAIWQTEADWEIDASNTAKTVSGLNENTQYTFKVKAKNGNNIETSYSGTTSLFTLAKVSLASTVNGPTTTSLNVAVNANANPSITQYAIQETTNSKYLQSNGSLGDNAIWQTEAVWETDATNTAKTVNGLSVNTQYTFNVKARNGNNVETDFSVTTSLFTLANVPSAPTVSNPTATSLDVSVNVNGNPTSTKFAIQDSVNGTFVQANGAMGIAAVWQTAATWGTKTVTGLSTGVTYYFRTKARNADNVETIYSLTTAQNTCSNPTSGGSISGLQTICYNTTPLSITSVSLPLNYGGTLEYKWQYSTTDSTSGFSDITSSNSATYSPEALTQTSWFKRLARVDCKSDWTEAAESNVIKITVNPVSVGGTITGTSTITYGSSTGTLTLGSYTGTIQKWQKKIGTGSWTDISNTTATYSEIPISAGIWYYKALVKSGICSEDTSAEFTVTVDKKALTITADNKTKDYDGLIYSPFTVNYNGFITGEDYTNLTGSLSFSGTATTAIDNGTYIIIPGGFTSNNYAISYLNGNLTINRAGFVNVTNNLNIGVGSLRNSIVNVANNGTITFSNGMNNQTITLTTGTLNINKNVTIDNSNLTSGITISGSGNNITINAGKVLTLSSGSKLTVTGAINNTAKGSSGLVIASGASFIHNTVDLPATVQRNLTNVWHLFGSPFKKNSGAMLANITGTTQMMPYTNGTGWGTTTTSPVTLFVPTVGYAIKPIATVTASFTGNLYYSAIPADYTTSLIYNGTSATQSWNLVANPYTSSIDFNLLGKTNLSSTLYYWDNAYKPNVTPIATASYMRSYNSITGVGVPAGTNSYIAPLQGFFVKAVYTSPKLAFTPSARVHKPITYYKDASNTEIIVRLQTETEEGSDELVICKNNNSKLGFEQFDSEKLFSDSPVEIYSQSTSGEKLVINTINTTDNTIIPLGIRGNTGKKVKITAFALETAEQVYLEDRFKGKLISLTENTAYEFELPTENLIGRFFIRFNNTNATLTTSDVKVFENDNELNIIAQTGEELQTIEVYSLTGACVFKTEGNSNVFTTKLQLAPAMYMVRVKTSIATQNVKVSWK